MAEALPLNERCSSEMLRFISAARLNGVCAGFTMLLGGVGTGKMAHPSDTIPWQGRKAIYHLFYMYVWK